MDSNTLVAQYDPKDEPRTNLHRWFNYLQFVESPNSYIVFSFYAAIMAALQRRPFKWHGDVQCYPNDFVILVGKPSLGKGRVIKPFKSLFDGFRYSREIWAYDENGNDTNPNKIIDIKDEIAEEEKAHLLKQAEDELHNVDKTKLVDDFLFPCPADSSSLRALSSYLANEGRSIRYLMTGPNNDKIRKTYFHASIVVVLEELASLFKDRRETKDMVDFLVQTWDSGNYRHATLGYGIDHIERCCVSMLAGTVPETIEELFTQKLMGAGLSSRTIFVYENELRFRRYPTAMELTDLQRRSFAELRLHIKKLSHIFGRVIFTDESEEYLRYWYEHELDAHKVIKNKKLEGFYGRKLAHIIKLAMAIHFAEHLTREVNLEEVKLAMDLITSLEPGMLKALSMAGRNEAYNVQKKILEYIRENGPVSSSALLLQFIEDLKSIDDLEEMLNTLVKIGSIVRDNGKYRMAKAGEQIIVANKVNGELGSLIQQQPRIKIA